LNPNRNENLWPEEIERILRGHLGAEKVVWLGGGLVDDLTDGHVDNVACFAGPGVVLALVANDPEDANYPVLQDNLKRLRGATDAAGRKIDVIEVEQPRARSDAKGRRMALSYINFYIANGGLIMPSFEDPADLIAYEAISQCFPDCEVVQLPALEIVSGSGGMHCITQQQPQV
jgi:agmatine deiminase